MQMRYAVCTAALAVPLLLGSAAPSAAEVDVGFGVGSPYYDSPYWGPYDGYYGAGYYPAGHYGLGPYDPYDDEVFLGAQVDVADNADVIVEPTAAEPAPCVKTNVKNLRNACPM